MSSVRSKNAYFAVPKKGRRGLERGLPARQGGKKAGGQDGRAPRVPSIPDAWRLAARRRACRSLSVNCLLLISSDLTEYETVYAMVNR